MRKSWPPLRMKSGRNRFAWLMRLRSIVLQRALDYEPRIFSGEAGLLEIACLTNADMVLIAIVGTGGLRPALAAIEAAKIWPWPAKKSW